MLLVVGFGMKGMLKETLEHTNKNKKRKWAKKGKRLTTNHSPGGSSLDQNLLQLRYKLNAESLCQSAGITVAKIVWFSK